MNKAKTIKIVFIAATVALVVIIAVVVIIRVIVPQNKYNNAVLLMIEGEYDKAITAFESLGDYKDCDAKITDCLNAKFKQVYKEALSLMDSGNYNKAIVIFIKLRDYKDSAKLIDESINLLKEKEREEKYQQAISYFNSQKFQEAYALFLMKSFVIIRIVQKKPRSV